MSRAKQLTLDGEILILTSEEEKALKIKVKSSFSKQMVHIKNDFGELTEGKKFKAVFSSATEHIFEVLNIIEQECPAAVKEWLQERRD